MSVVTRKKIRTNLIKLAVLSLLTHALSLFAEHAVETGQQAGKASAESSGKRPVRSDWDPHALVAGLLDRTNGPHKTNWSQEPADFFEREFGLLRTRLQGLGSEDLDTAELASIQSRAERIAKAISVISERTQSIKSAIKQNEPDAEGKQKRAESLETALQLHAQTAALLLGRIRDMQEAREKNKK